MTNYIRLGEMSAEDLGGFLGDLAYLFDPLDCRKCIAYEDCDGKDDTNCATVYTDWLRNTVLSWHDDKSITNLDMFRALPVGLAVYWLGNRFGECIRRAKKCEHCPAFKQCCERKAVPCRDAYKDWLDAEYEEDRP